MTDVRFDISGVGDQFIAAFTALDFSANGSALAKMMAAATMTIREAGSLLKTMGRANIAAGGMSKKWQNAWRVEVFPKSGYSLDAAAYGHHNIPYSPIFQDGGTITGKKGLLWIPMETVPKLGKRTATARQLSSAGVKLFSINRNGRHPLLAAKVSAAGGAQNLRGVVSLPRLRSGTDAVKIRDTSRKRAKQRGGVKASDAGGRSVTVPLFVGVPSVTIKARFDLRTVTQNIVARLPELYAAHAPNEG